MRRASLLCIVGLVVPLMAGARTIRVPKDHPHIGTALIIAAPYDTILVAPGTYIENIVWPSKAGIKLLGEMGPDSTVLDGDGRASVIGIYTGVDTATVISGFTIRDGYAEGT